MFPQVIPSVLCLSVSASSLSGWQDLGCEEGHKYLFSDKYRHWQEAREECELYGGWLVDINSQREQNCLVRFAHSSGLHAGWFWHDGKALNFYRSLICIFLKSMMLLMKEFSFTPGITLTSLGSIICSLVVVETICTTEDMITTCWVSLAKLTLGQEHGVMNQG